MMIFNIGDFVRLHNGHDLAMVSDIKSDHLVVWFIDAKISCRLEFHEVVLSDLYDPVLYSVIDEEDKV